MYYNQITKKILSRRDLKNLINCSIPSGQETIGDWLLIHDEIPERQEGKIIVKDSVEIVDGIAVQMYRYDDLPNENIDEYDRISLLENAVMDLAQIVSDLEYRRNNSENLTDE
jgi:hypothetical protein